MVVSVEVVVSVDEDDDDEVVARAGAAANTKTAAAAVNAALNPFLLGRLLCISVWLKDSPRPS